jgi:Transcriptional regulatory protein, C terminal/WD40-like Beta Propeller Repeat
LRVLLFLLENPGQVVTREQIQQKLWPDNTHVDYENAINSAVRKLRDALSDSSENPRFVETLARRGYRFIAPVTRRIDPRLALGTVPPESGVPSVGPGTLGAKHREMTWAAVLFLVVAAAGAAFWILRDHPAAPAELKSVPLTAFRGYERYTSFSPDEKEVAFSWDCDKQDNLDIYVMLIGSGKPLRLTTDPAVDVAPAWSPDRDVDRICTARG